MSHHTQTHQENLFPRAFDRIAHGFGLKPSHIITGCMILFMLNLPLVLILAETRELNATTERLEHRVASLEKLLDAEVVAWREQ